LYWRPSETSNGVIVIPEEKKEEKGRKKNLRWVEKRRSTIHIGGVLGNVLQTG